MYRDFMPEMVEVRRQEYLAEAKRRGFARKALDRPSIRARMARSLFDAAFAVEADESWRAMWDRMSRPARKDRRRPGAVGKR